MKIMNLTECCYVFADITYQPNYFSMSEPGVGRFLVSLMVQGVVFNALLFVIELQCVRTVCRLFASLGRKRKQVEATKILQLDRPLYLETAQTAVNIFFFHL